MNRVIEIIAEAIGIFIASVIFVGICVLTGIGISALFHIL